jgi:hypothetical protein
MADFRFDFRQEMRQYVWMVRIAAFGRDWGETGCKILVLFLRYFREFTVRKGTAEKQECGPAAKELDVKV